MYQNIIPLCNEAHNTITYIPFWQNLDFAQQEHYFKILSLLFEKYKPVLLYLLNLLRKNDKCSTSLIIFSITYLINSINYELCCSIMFYTLMIADRNECDLPVCSQTCIDTEGSYSCGCHQGYQLSSDKTTCTGN